jgi:hypothetical protein
MSYRTALAAIWTALLLTACWLPQRNLPDGEIPRSFAHIPHADKIVHTGLFGVFAVAWMRALRSERRRVWIALAGIALAITTELVQGIPAIHRDPSVLDALADVVGIAAGLGFYALWEGSTARFAALAGPPALPTKGG